MANLRVDKITSTETFETTGSVYFDGNNDKLIVGSAGDFNYLHNGAASFTAEFWVYTEIANQRQVVFSTGGNSSSTGFVVRIMASGAAGSSNGYLVGAQTSKSSSGNYLYWDSESTQLAANTWYHIATVYDHTDNTLKIYVDGKLTNSGFSRTQGTFGDHATGNSQAGIYIGEEAYNNSLDLKGFVSNLRIINGVKLYTSNFKPPMKELEVIPGTTVLCCQSKTNELLEKTGKTIVMNGTAAPGGLTPGLLTPVPKAGAGSAITGSVEFDGYINGTSSSHLRIIDNEDLNMGTGEFTFEAWINPVEHNGTNSPNFMGFFSSADYGGSSGSITIQVKNDGKLRYIINGGSGTPSDDETGSTVLWGSWHHVAIVRSGTTIKGYVNGVEEISSSYSTAVDFTQGGSTVIGELAVDNYYGDYPFKGFISNLRLVKGTALYTDKFTPPTRELKKVPGTVLLCCQDPDDVTTEATGKTITGYGSLSRTDIGGNLVTNGDFSVNTNGWSVLNTGTFTASGGQATLSDSDGTGTSPVAYQEITTFIPGAMYMFQFDTTAAREAYAYVSTTAGSNTLPQEPSSTYAYPAYTGSLTGTRYIRFRATQPTMQINFSDGSGSDFDITVDNVKVYKLDPGNKASNFTPQVGDDRKVTFEGVTKINSDAYFYLPTGDTVTRNTRSGRGVLGGGRSPSSQNIIDFVNIASTGNAQDFGDLTRATMGAGACSSVTRGLFGSGASPGADNTIEFVTIATTGNAQNFGDLTYAPQACGAVSNNTRGIFAGGEVSSNSVNTINFVTIASTGDAKDFGDLVQTRRQFIGSCSSPTRGLFAGGYQDPASTRTNAIEFITISSTGNGIDFGDLTTTVDKLAGVSSKTRGVFAGGFSPSSPNRSDTIAYVTIASTGDAIDFGDLIVETFAIGGGASNSERGLYTGGATPSVTNAIDYITIASTGDAKDFGDLVMARRHPGGVSDSHGGLG